MNTNPLIVNTDMAAGLDVVGDRWALLILRDAFLGRSRFEQLRQFTGASKATLTRRLESLIQADVLYKKPYSKSGNRVDYKLTKKGLGLFASSLMCWQWESQWTELSAEVLPVNLIHKNCGHAVNAKAVCRHCSQPLQVNDVKWPELGNQLGNQLSSMQSFNKRRVRTSATNTEQDQSLATVSDLIGDRWTLLILISSFLGVNRYDSFLKQLNIASNILTDRLNLLVDVNIFKRINYQENPPRSEYLLTAKGKSLFPLVMVIRQWVIDWMPKEAVENLVHKGCGEKLVVDVVCSGCDTVPQANQVQFLQTPV